MGISIMTKDGELQIPTQGGGAQALNCLQE